jgi:hypothetical protein
MIIDTDLLDMPPEAVYDMVMAGDVRPEEFCQWFNSQTGDSQADGYASGWSDGYSDGFDAGNDAGYDSGYEDGSKDSAGDDELEIDDTTGQVK